MATKRLRTRARTGADTLTEAQLFYMSFGWGLDSWGAESGLRDDCGGFVPFADWPAVQAAWEAHRLQVIAAARADGCLPWAFWEFEATEGLLQLAGPAPLEPVELWKGRPRLWATQADAELAIFEVEDSYVRRLRLDPATLRPVKR